MAQVRRNLVVGVALVALLATAAGCGADATNPLAATPVTTAPRQAREVPGEPPELKAHRADWVLPGRDYDNSRSSFDSAIDGASVARLQPAWEATVTGPLSTVPLIVGDTAYVQDGRGTVQAVDMATGAVRWKSSPYGFNIGPFGVSVAGGRVFAVRGSDGIVALDAATGAELWQQTIVPNETTGVDIQPLAYDDLVLASTVPISIGGIYTPGDHGVLTALDAATGEVRWTWDTVEPGLWGHPEVNSGGGSWYPPAIDPEAGVVYWGVANPAPFPGTPEYPNGSSRPGDNLYTNSAVAIDLETGQMRWYHQVHPHDLFDRDLVHTMIVRFADGSHNVVATGKGGVVVGLDPDTGSRRWEHSVGLHENDQLTELPGPTRIAPGTFGGVLTPPASADGTVYTAVVNAPAELPPDQPSYFGADMGQMDGEVVAVDARTGSRRWATKVPGDPLGGATVVNDLVLTALLEGQVVALDRASGRIVWTTQLPGGTNGWMAVAGDTLLVPAGNASPPRLVAYKLAGG